MNIPDKRQLYSEVARVARPGGRFAHFDVLAGPNQPIHFPVPWASDQSFSFLLPPKETRALVTQAGFRELRWLEGQELEAELERPDRSGEEAPASDRLNPGLLTGPDGPRMGPHVPGNMKEGRILFALEAVRDSRSMG